VSGSSISFSGNRDSPTEAADAEYTRYVMHLLRARAPTLLSCARSVALVSSSLTHIKERTEPQNINRGRTRHKGMQQSSVQACAIDLMCAPALPTSPHTAKGRTDWC
jgi:hypothetical protein